MNFLSSVGFLSLNFENDLFFASSRNYCLDASSFTLRLSYKESFLHYQSFSDFLLRILFQSHNFVALSITKLVTKPSI